MNEAVQFNLYRMKYFSFRVRFEKELDLTPAGFVNDQTIIPGFFKRKIDPEII